MPHFLLKKRSDLIFAVPLLIIWIIIVSLLFAYGLIFFKLGFLEFLVAFTKEFPLIIAAIYLSGKAIIEDIIRIKKGISIRMPGFIYIVYGFQWVCLLFISESINLNRALGHSSLVTQSTGINWFINSPMLLWLIIDILALIVFKYYIGDKLNKKYLNLSKDQAYENKLMNRYYLSYITSMIALIISMIP